MRAIKPGNFYNKSAYRDRKRFETKEEFILLNSAASSSNIN